MSRRPVVPKTQGFVEDVVSVRFPPFVQGDGSNHPVRLLQTLAGSRERIIIEVGDTLQILVRHFDESGQAPATQAQGHI